MYKLITLAGVLAVAAAGPALEKVMEMAVNDQEGLVAEIRASPLAAIAEFSDAESLPKILAKAKADGVPVVFAHGMGDSCFNSGMRSITDNAAAHLGVYGTCIGNGNNVLTDVINGFLMNMDRAVDDFADRIRKDANLADGFVCVGFSQGNSLCRGYIQKHNLQGPVARAHVSVHGTISGVASFPQCDPEGRLIGFVCKALNEVLGALAYNPLVQGILFQANYFRAPTRVATSAYLSNSQIAGWNNENPAAVEASYKTSFGLTEQHVLVKALKDTMVFPTEGQWYGAFEDGGYDRVLNLTETRFYKEDLFGLKTADEAGKFIFATTTGGHLTFASSELYQWLDMLDVYQ